MTVTVCRACSGPKPQTQRWNKPQWRVSSEPHVPRIMSANDKKALKEAKKAARTEALLAKKAEREAAANGDVVEVRGPSRPAGWLLGGRTGPHTTFRHATGTSRSLPPVAAIRECRGRECRERARVRRR